MSLYNNPCKTIMIKFLNKETIFFFFNKETIMIIMHHVTYHCMAWQSRCYRSARIMRGTLSCVIDFQVSYPISRDLISALQIHLIFAREKTRLILIRNGPFVMHAVCRRIYHQTCDNYISTYKYPSLS